MTPPHTATANARPNDDLDDLFNFLDEDNNASNPTTLPQTSNTTTSAAPNRRRLEGDDPLGLGLGIDEEVKVRKPRAPIAKLDEERILSEKGIPRLRRITKERLRFKGKGHEFQDVSRLLNTYQLWLDQLFPKANFADGITMIEKLGHKKRTQVMRKAWIDEDRPKPAIEEDQDFVADNRDGVADAQGVDADLTMVGALDERNTESARREGGLENNESQGIGQLRSSSPLMLDDEELYAGMDGNIAKVDEMQEPDEDELDALLAEETATERPAAMQPTAQKLPNKGDDFADDEEAMAEMDMW